MKLSDFFTHIIVINLERRWDRWLHCLHQFEVLGIRDVIRFNAHDQVLVSEKVNGNAGCTASHRGVLELIAHNRWPRTLVLEDDFELRSQFTDNHGEIFESAIQELPSDWDLFYLGGHYGEAPISRIGPHVIRCGRMLTTSSYGITHQFARRLAPYICGVGPIDNLVSGWNHEAHAYIMQPRLFIQYTNFSDLQERDMCNSACMEDPNHENMV